MAKFLNSLMAALILLLFHANIAVSQTLFPDTPSCYPTKCPHNPDPSKFICPHVGCTEMPDASDIPPDVTRMNLRGNRISEIKPLLKLPLLRHLDLSSNNIRSVDPSSFKDAIRLEVLNMSDNALGSVAFRSDNVEELYLVGNSIKEIGQDAFCRNPLACPLRVLDLRGNHISSMNPNAVDDLRELQVLDLSENNLAELDKLQFRGLMNVRNISLRENHLLELSADAFEGALNLESLDVSGNKLTTLKQGKMAESLFYLPHVRINFSGNKWNCDCNMSWIKELSHPANERFGNAIVCHSPWRIRGRTLSSLLANELNCDDVITDSHRLELSLLGISLIAFFVLLVALAVWRWRYRLLPCRYHYARLYDARYDIKEAETEGNRENEDSEASERVLFKSRLLDEAKQAEV